MRPPFLLSSEGAMELNARTYRSWRWIGELFVSLAVLAGLAMLAGQALANPGRDIKGFISEGIGDVLLFSPCHGKTQSKKQFRLLDKTNNEVLSAGVQEVRHLMLDRSQPMYAEFRGDTAGVVVTARQLHRLIGHIDSCPAAPTDIAAGTRLLASGEEPFWRFTLAADGGRLQMDGLKQPIRFPANEFKAPSVVDKARIYDAWSPLDGGTVRIEIEERMCSDGRSEVATGARVTLRYVSKSFEGCATRF
jgi:uncharacterized membrane protein